MLDIGWSELLVIGVVALIVVGPKDLPILFRRMGEFTGKARSMAREFTRAMENAADEAGVKDIKTDLRKMADPKRMGLDAINDAAKDMSGWSHLDDDTVARGTPPKPGEPLSEERAAAARKIEAAASAKAHERQAREAATGDDAPETPEEKSA